VFWPLYVDLRPLTDPSFTLRLRRKKGWQRKQRKGLGLTQACHLLREETLPIHYDNVTVSVLRAEANEYIKNFFPDPSKAIGTLFLEIATPSQLFDLTPSICVARRSPNMAFRSSLGQYLGGKRMMRILDQLLDVSGDSLWHASIENVIASVKVGLSIQYRLFIEVRPAHPEPWMPFVGSKTNKQSNEHALSWLSKIGLEGSNYKARQIEIKVGTADALDVPQDEGP
jgi:hypothetical protein